MAIKLQEEELQFKDIRNLWRKAQSLGAKMVSRYFNFEINPDTDILIESMLIQQGYALITAAYSKIPLRFRLTVTQKKAKLQLITSEVTFEEDIDGEGE
ncbi:MULTISPECIES: hypothetical protein [Metallosphaera]|uniref:Uncharacterized protein n=3 Tax=Metallosphaera TaxID=41980 RepID=A4YD14_METS5|nr:MULTISPECIES: hypothetical protein [Metallosphaera]ABP94316.1 hypothetical protein Msed_0139 [Metallosphaera sedula DSM 5348]AIM26303.1 hypothetical protein HA72_0139 [Metallosphaera sedula]QCO30097.1 hypothetical protein DFR88_05960 [Metallosphaera prunae]WPX06371.1 hypothetical protein SOJ17_000053 [Metallosphaera sedula DSM 5348]BBL46122.1 hypothetical protein MJ1HA_0215 [Metallosphaera sedula]